MEVKKVSAELTFKKCEVRKIKVTLELTQE